MHSIIVSIRNQQAPHRDVRTEILKLIIEINLLSALPTV